MKEKVYFWIIKIPDYLFTSIQLLLMLRFIAKIVIPGANFILLHILYLVTDILSFPVAVCLSYFFSDGSFLFEAGLVTSSLMYLALYRVTMFILNKIFSKEEVE